MQTTIKAAVLAVASATALGRAQPAPAPRYAASRGSDVVRLEDRASQTVVSVLPSVGNITFELTVKGHNVLYWPSGSVDTFKARPDFSGIPFLGPWANRLDEQAFYANGKKYAFDMQLGNVRGAIPIHGLLTFSNRWQVTDVTADATGARVTSRLEFYKYPELMQQFPFAHTIEITQTLSNGALQIGTKIENLSADPMPVAIGFHPYFQITDVPRDQWTIAVGARKQWLLAPNKIPTGEVEPIEKLLPDPRATPLARYDLDHVFGDLIASDEGRAVMSVKGKEQQIDVLFGPKYKAAVIYAPAGRSYICFEPMVGITDAMNLAHKGLYPELQSVPAGGVWQESFWIRPKGF